MVSNQQGQLLADSSMFFYAPFLGIFAVKMRALYLDTFAKSERYKVKCLHIIYFNILLHNIQAFHVPLLTSYEAINSSGHVMEKGKKEVRFVADVMVGKLAKWLRVLGYDTHYQPHYSPEAIDAFVREGRILLTRHKRRAEKLGNAAVLIRGNQVSEQLIELKRELHLEPARSTWFSRCLICNAILRHACEGVAGEKIPEYVLYQNRTNISFCPLCGRYFWPGSHRARMEKQLKEWGFPLEY